MEKLELSIKEGTSILEVRTGAALPLHELKTLSLKGSLRAPADFLSIRKPQFPVEGTHIIVNEDKATITINSQDRDDVGKVSVTGSLEMHPDYVRMGINADNYRSATELANWIKMNRSLFDSKTAAMSLVTLLRNFKATVNKIMEDKSDDRANYSVMREQVVNSTLPEAFNVTIPLFVGESPVTFKVEVIIDPEDFSCALLSPDAADMIKEGKALRIAEQIARFDGYAIIYQ